MRRKQKSLSQIAKDLGVSKSYLSMILSGQRRATPELISKLQSIRGVHKIVNFQSYSVLPKQDVGSSNLLTRSNSNFKMTLFVG